MAGTLIALLTAGTRGDVAPFVALALGLRRAGYEVRLCVPASYAPLADEQGLPHASIDDELLRLKETPEGREALSSPSSRLRLIRRVRPMLRRQLDDAWAGCESASLVIAHPKTLAGPHIAERLGIECLVALPLPMLVPTRTFLSPAMPRLLPGMVGNRLSHALARLAYAPFGGVVNGWRTQVLGLPRRRRPADPTSRPDGTPHPVLFAFSSTLVPRPADWGSHVHVTGDWPLADVGWSPPADLLSFLSAGPTPIYVGFGSIPSSDAARTSALVLEALALAGRRGVLATGGGGLARVDAPGTVFFLPHVSHRWLFDRVAAVVHHGGAGTTHAGLRAGRPTVVCPIFGDQSFWASRVAALGAGPGPLPLRGLTPQRLAAAMTLATSEPSLSEQARLVGNDLRKEDGVARAVSLVTRALGE